MLTTEGPDMSEPVLIPDSKERVALDLARTIVDPTRSPDYGEEAWLALYWKCLQAVRGSAPATVSRPR